MFRSSVMSFVVCALFCSSVWSQQVTQRRDLFDAWDKNKDGKLTKDELPERLRGNFNRVDADSDGFISRDEDRKFRQRALQARGRNQIPEGAVAHKDLAYVPKAHERQKLDLYLPKKDGKSDALIVWIHGGGWRNGSKNSCPAVTFVKEGFAVASINYRLSGHAKFPAQIHDCKAAIRWLRANAKKYEIDDKQIGVWGSSAGGHLVALVGTSGDTKQLEGELGNADQSSRVQAVCDYFGPTDFLTMNAQSTIKGPIDHDAENSPESLLMGGPIQKNKELVKAASPLTYVTKDDPPFLIVHGDMDPLVPLAQSKTLHEKLTKAGVSSNLHVVEGAGHGRFNDPKIQTMVLEFFRKQLQKK